MEIDFYVQSQAFLYSILLGVALGILYGSFKFIRTAFLSTKPAVIISDIAFMIVASLALFFYSLAMLYGYVRIYVVFGALCGFAAYRFSLGKLISRIYCPIINALNVVNKKIRTKFKKITEKLLKIGNNILYNIDKKIDTFRNKQKGLSVRKKVKASNENEKEKTAD
jgi:spore cortex biosynthesis protein YabQ